MTWKFFFTDPWEKKYFSEMPFQSFSFVTRCSKASISLS